jgi:DNA excision repair protein ERCC-5
VRLVHISLNNHAEKIYSFLGEELGWPQVKVDELLLPIIQRLRQRQQVLPKQSPQSQTSLIIMQVAALNKQGTLGEYVTGGNGSLAPRKRRAYASERLQQVVTDFRTKRAKLEKQTDAVEGVTSDGSASDNDTEKGPARKKSKGGNATGKKSKAEGSSLKAKPGGSGKKVGKAPNTGGKKAQVNSEAISSDEYNGENIASDEPLRVQLRPRRKPAYKQTE